MAFADKPSESELVALQIAKVAHRQVQRSRTHAAEFRLGDFVDQGVEVSSLAELAGALRFLLAANKAALVFRVVSPTGHGGLAEYQSFEDIPSRISDRFDDDNEVVVTPEMVVPVYIFR